MKTMMKIPKTSLLLLMVLFLSLSCSSDDDAPAPDPKADFVGSFEMDDFDMRILITNSGTVDLDSIVSVTNNPEIEFSTEEGLNEDALKAELVEFMETLWGRTFTALGSPSLTTEVEIQEESIAKISGNDFSIDDFESEVTLSDGTNSEIWEFDFSGEGEMEENELSLEFNITYSVGTGSLELTGTAIGEKE